MRPRFIPLFVFLLQYFQLIISVNGTNITTTTLHLCSSRNNLLLWQFQRSFQIDADVSDCQHSYPKTKTWNRSVDCCTWDGVTCDERSGEIIGLDLSCSQLQGPINSNSTLFQLTHLQTLNLALNDFFPSQIDLNFASFRSLTHLNLSSCAFSGSLPLEFSRMYKLISLDLTNTRDIVIEPHTFTLLLQNLTQLRQLSLEYCKIPSTFPGNLSASLQLLNLRYTGVFGELPVEIFQLPNLRTLQLSINNLASISSEKVYHNTTRSPLRYLDLSSNDFSGQTVPGLIGNLKHLWYLDLSQSNFSGPFPEFLGNLTQVTHLILHTNNFTGKLPPNLGNLDRLIFFDLYNNSLEGQLPNIFSNFKSLTSLFLSTNHFTGCFPPSITNLTKLEVLDMSFNSLIGPLPPNTSSGFPNLSTLDLEENSINGTIPFWVFNLPSLTELNMRYNQLAGQLYEFQYQSLQLIFLSNNKLNGTLPKSISKQVNLDILELSNNNFGGVVEVSFFSSLQVLSQLFLSFTNLSLNNNQLNSTFPHSLDTLYASSCGLRDLDFLRGIESLSFLDVSNNMLQSDIFSQKNLTWGRNLVYLNVSHNVLTYIPQFPFPSLNELDLSFNFLSGPLFMPSPFLTVYHASNNAVTGEIPLSICNNSYLSVLDLSNNKMIGEIPPCLRNISQLSIFDLHSNNFQGTIPSIFSLGCQVINFNLRDNQLEGEVPRSLSYCLKLELLDIGNNHLQDTFPWWLGTLPNLQVLSLRVNHFHGSLNNAKWGFSFPALKILDLSQNKFTGSIPASFFIQFTSMKIASSIKKRLFNELGVYYSSSVLVITKGMEIDIVHVLSIYTTVDLSSNKFQGIIPGAIGNLISLRGLNLSHNNFSGSIPQTLANLTFLESLDLSSNKIDGEIPQPLVSLTNLEVLNLSENHLVGTIPRGSQFETFDNTSYLGNDGLCGFPLSRDCGAKNVFLPTTSETPTQSDDGEIMNFINGFSWQSVLIGYGTGVLIGVSIGCFIFITGKPQWFNKFVEKECSKFRRKKWPKEVKWL